MMCRSEQPSGMSCIPCVPCIPCMQEDNDWMISRKRTTQVPWLTTSIIFNHLPKQGMGLPATTTPCLCQKATTPLLSIFGDVVCLCTELQAAYIIKLSRLSWDRIIETMKGYRYSNQEKIESVPERYENGSQAPLFYDGKTTPKNLLQQTKKRALSVNITITSKDTSQGNVDTDG